MLIKSVFMLSQLLVNYISNLYPIIIEPTVCNGIVSLLHVIHGLSFQVFMSMLQLCLIHFNFSDSLFELAHFVLQIIDHVHLTFQLSIDVLRNDI